MYCEMHSEGVKGRNKKGANYDKAMNEAFNEIFQNLKEIEKNTKKFRQKADFERRKGSAPPAALREATAAFKKPKGGRKLSTPLPPEPSSLHGKERTTTSEMSTPLLTKSSLPEELTRTELSAPPLPPKSSMSTMHWVLSCFEEEENMQDSCRVYYTP